MTGTVPSGVEHEVDRLLTDAPAFRRLDRQTQSEMRDAIGKISSFLSQAHAAPARQLAPNPGSLRPGGAPPPPASPSSPASPPVAPSPSGGAGANGGTTP